jgi:hypothetical protein
MEFLNRPQTRRRTTAGSGALALIGAAIAACITTSATPRAQGSAVLTLGVPGRSNATVSIASDGAFVAAVWAATVPSGGTDIFAATSRDGGATFSTPVQVNHTPGDARVSGEQPPRVTILSGRAGPAAIVVVWTSKHDADTVLLAARSDDGGRTFGASAVVPGSQAPGNRGWESAVAAGGSVHVAWLDHREMARSESPAGTPHHAHDASATAKKDGAAMAQLSKLYVARLGDPRSATPITGGVCYCCKTALVTGSGGSVFAAWRHVYPGNFRDIAFTMSRDGGKTFAPPVRVSQDNWMLEGCPDDGPTLVVDRSGAGQTVHVVWPTLVGTPEEHVVLMHAATRDGRTFTPREPVPTLGSLKPSHPQMTLDRGDLVLAWDEVIGGRRRVAMSRAAAGADGRARFGDPTTISADASSVYPVVASVPDAVLAAWTSGPPDSSTIAVRRITRNGGTR